MRIKLHLLAKIDYILYNKKIIFAKRINETKRNERKYTMLKVFSSDNVFLRLILKNFSIPVSNTQAHTAPLIRTDVQR
jgi:hypothetical protein